VRVGLGQLNIIWENKDANKIKCEKIVSEARQKCVDFLIFPEMTLTGFTMQTGIMGEALNNSDTIRFFKKCAMTYELAIAFGIIIDSNDKAYNNCIIVNASGEVICNYSKIHPFTAGKEAAYYSGGNQIVFCDIKEFTVAPTICYDLRFPEIYQAASKKAGLIIVIANWPETRAHHWHTLLKARAIENQSYVIGVNKTGQDPKLNYLGGSVIISPFGNIITKTTQKEGLITGDINMKEVNDVRVAMNLKSDRREELYIRLFQK